jgi:hypothetical protein
VPARNMRFKRETATTGGGWGVSDESEELVGAITCPGLFQGSNSSNKSSASSGVVTLSDEQLQLLEV